MSRSQITKYSKYNLVASKCLEAILDHLNVEYFVHNDNVFFECPIHESTDVRHASIRTSDGVFRCWSGDCHNLPNCNKTTLGFLKCYLSKIHNKDLDWNFVFDFVDNFHDYPIDKLSIPQHKTNTLRIFDKSEHPEVIIPSEYYLGRGFKKETLQYFGVGDSTWWEKAIVPIYYVSGEYVGFSGRSIHPECPTCHYHHSKYTHCVGPHAKNIVKYIRWYHKKGMSKEFILYNMNNVAKSLADKVAIVEGQSCCWRLHEYEIDAVSVMGREFNGHHRDLLKRYGKSKVLLVADNDPKGQEFRQKFIAQYNGDFQIFLPSAGLISKDPSDMSDDEIQSHILNIWNKI